MPRKGRILALATIIGGIWFQQATASTIVVPGVDADVEGTSSLIWLLQGIPTRIQTVIGASELIGIPSGSLITGLSWRRDAVGFLSSNPWPLSTLTAASYQVTLSSSIHPPNSLSLVFDENIGTDKVLAFNGPLTIPESAYPIGSAPNAFGLTLSFSTPFVYDSGNMLIDIVHSGSGDPGFGMQFDAVDRPVTLQTLVQWPGSPANPGPAITGFDFFVAPVFQLSYQPVPEPASWIVLVAGVAIVALRARRPLTRPFPNSTLRS